MSPAPIVTTRMGVKIAEVGRSEELSLLIILPIEYGPDALLRLVDVRVLHRRRVQLALPGMVLAQALQLIVLPRSVLREGCLNRWHFQFVCALKLHILRL